MPRSATVLILASLCFAAACSDDIEDLCSDIADCGFITEHECVDKLMPYEFSEACMSRMQGASCQEHQTMSYWFDCWQPCEGDDHFCSGDSVVGCMDGALVTIDCERLCNAKDLPYAGECGITSPNGEVAEYDVCWCVVYQ